MKVYIIQEGEYENRGITGVASTVTDAIQLIKDQFHSPYIVDWGEPRDCGGHWELAGKFEAVVGYSVCCMKRFEITEHEVYIQTSVPIGTRVTN